MYTSYDALFTILRRMPDRWKIMNTNNADLLVSTDVIRCPVTALLCVGGVLCTGEGSYLHLYNLKTRAHIKQLHVLKSSVVHGIKALSSNIVVFGQKSLCVATLNDDQIEVKSGVAEFSDWIWDVQWLTEPEGHLALALGHNTAVLWDSQKQICVQSVSCEENCILYSAHFIGDTWCDLILAAGVVFNEVVIWSPNGLKNSEGRSLVQGRLKGHEGVIFNIYFNIEKQTLCSVSDDRTIRVWNLQIGHIISSNQPELTLYGHGARVWDARLLANVIVSIGEDACCLIWDYSGNVLKKFTGHKGQNIWSLTVNERLGLVITGGGDSSIRLWSLDFKTKGDYITETLDVEAGVKSVLGNERSHDDSGFVPRLLVFLKNQDILIMMQNGTMLGYNLCSKEWRCVLQNDEFQSYCVMQESPDQSHVAVGSIKGSIWLYSVDNGVCLFKEDVYSDCKVLSVCWATENDLFTSGPDGKVIWWKIRNQEDQVKMYHFGDFILPYSRHRWVTSVSLLPGESGFVCGDKRGSVFFYKGQPKKKAEPQEPCHSHIAVHGKTGVSHIHYHDGFAYSAGRNGTYCKYTVTEGWNLQLVNTFKVYKGFDWLERLVFQDSDLLVMGFHSADFVVHNVTSNESIMKVTCGGGHRSWGVTHSSRRTSFAYIKTKQVFVCTMNDAQKSQVILKPDLHGRVIRCITYLGQTELVEGAECAVLATGSEDTLVNINAIISSPGKPCRVFPVHHLQAHISVVCSLACCPSTLQTEDENQSVLLFSSGGRVTIHVWRVTLPSRSTLEAFEKNVCVEHLAFCGTVDNSTRRRHLKKLKESNKEPDPETRYMDVKVLRRKTDDRISIFIAGSDGVLRLFSFCELTRNLVFLSKSASFQCCFLSLHIEDLLSGGEVTPLLCSGGTDGTVRFWDMTSSVRSETSNIRTDTSNIRSETPNIRSEISGIRSETSNITFEAKMEVGPNNIVGNIRTDKLLESEISSQFPSKRALPDNSNGDRTDSFQLRTELYLSGNCSEGEKQETVIHKDGTSSQERIVSSFEPDNINQEGNAVKMSDDVRTCEIETTGKKIPRQLSEIGCNNESEIQFGDVIYSIQEAHQSGINSLAVKQLSDDRLLFASGGDDNSVTVHLLEFRRTGVKLCNLKAVVHDSNCQKFAHAAQITGLCFLDTNTLISCSVDQRFNIWKFQLPSSGNALKVAQSSCNFICIADISGLAAWKNRQGDYYFAISGQGIQIIHLEKRVASSSS